MIIFRATLSLIFVSWITASGLAANVKTLDQELHEVDTLRAGRKTPFDDVEKQCKSLLGKYTSREERGKIYFELAHVYAQGGQVNPARTIEWAKKALEFPLDPSTKMLTYVYWGDAVQVAHAGVRNKELMEARREAVVPYLMGLKELAPYDLPEKRPEVPRVGGLDYSGEQDTETYPTLKRKQDEQIAARKLALFQREMILHRDTLTGQVAFMYSRFPFASKELRELAAKYLGDESAVDQLMLAVDAAVRKRVEDLGGQSKIALPQPQVDGSAHEAAGQRGMTARPAASTIRPVLVRKAKVRPMAAESGGEAKAMSGKWRLGLMLTLILVVASLLARRTNVGWRRRKWCVQTHPANTQE